MVRYLDIGPNSSKRRLSFSGIMPDLLHPNERGYQIWAAAMEPALDEMLK